MSTRLLSLTKVAFKIRAHGYELFELMKFLEDVHKRQIRLTDERQEHIKTQHPEMSGQVERISETLSDPDRIIRTISDPNVEMFYRYYEVTPVTKKYLCVLVKVLADDAFIITAYFTDTVKRGELLWRKK